MRPNDDAAVQELYRTFGEYHFRLKYYCSGCLEKRERQTLSATPLHLLTAEDLVPYTVSAMLTVGDAQDVKYFLPRLFELLVVRRCWPGVERFIDMIVRAGWSHWPPVEQQAVRDALFSRWDAMLMASVPSFEVIEYLNVIAYAEESLTPFFQQWQRACVSSSPALAHLACWIVDHPSLALGHVEHYPPAQEAQTLLWLLGWQEQLELLFIQSFVEAEQRLPDTQETMQNADSALQILGWLKQAGSDRQRMHP